MREDLKENVNAEYIKEIDAYLAHPVAPCSKRRAIQLLKQFNKTDFRSFWFSPVNDYLPAVSEGTMKLAETIYPHDEAIFHAKDLIDSLNRDDLVRAFLYGTAHNAPEYRTALACYYYIQNLPEHVFERNYIGTNAEGNVYSEHTCEVCKYNDQLSDEPKMRFWHSYVDMYGFYVTACVPFCFNLNRAILYLEEYKKLPSPPYKQKDLTFFEQVITVIEALPGNTTPSKLRKALKSSLLSSMTVAQVDAFIDMLGYLNILHTDDSFGVTVGHTKERDMLYPLSDRSFFAHPVNRWTGKCGIDHDMIRRLFSGLNRP